MRRSSPRRYSVSTVSSVRQTILFRGKHFSGKHIDVACVEQLGGARCNDPAASIRTTWLAIRFISAALWLT